MDDDVMDPAGARRGRPSVAPAALQHLIDAAPEGIAVVDAETDRFEYVNPAGCRLLGSPLEEILASRSLFPAPADRSVPGGPVTAELVIGTRVLEHVTTTARVDGRSLRMVHFRDVSRDREHARHLAAFRRTSAGIAFAGPLPTVLDRLADEVRQATGMLSCTFMLMDDDGRLRRTGTVAGAFPDVADYTDRLEECHRLGAPLLSTSAFRDRRPVLAHGWRQRVLADPRFAPLHDVARTASWSTLATVPVISRGEVMGVLNGFYLAGSEPTPGDIPFLTAIADQAAVAVENARLVGELESRAAVEERHLLARELHDSVNQALFSLELQVRALELGLQDDHARPGFLAQRLSQIRELTESAHAEMRALLTELRPAGLREAGLVAAVRKHAADVGGRSELAITVDAAAEELTIAPVVEEQLFWVVREALHNVVKHADATCVQVRIDDDAGQGVQITVTDDGKGFDSGAGGPGHLGLHSMTERMAQVGGALEITSGSGGTVVRARASRLVGPCPEPLSTGSG